MYEIYIPLITKIALNGKEVSMRSVKRLGFIMVEVIQSFGINTKDEILAFERLLFNVEKS